MDPPAVANTSSLAAMLDRDITHTQLREWLQEPARDIHARLVQLALLSDPHNVNGTVSTSHRTRISRSTTTLSVCSGSVSSMAPTHIHQSNTSNHPPSLYSHFSEATPTETSVSTGLASRFSGVPLLEEVNGVLERPLTQIRAPIYECAFWFLSCGYISSNQAEWRTHCLSHFRGRTPPRSVSCPLCSWTWTCEDGATAWNARLDHIACYHTMLGETLKTSRPDFHLYTHLWQQHLICDADYKELKGGNHTLTRPPGNYVTDDGPRERDRRGQRTQRVGLARR